MTDDDLTLLALRVLEDATRRARMTPIAADHGTRLALAWLDHAQIMTTASCRLFWQQMQEGDTFHDAQPRYVRHGNLSNLVGYCFHKLEWTDLSRLEGKPMCNRYRPGERQLIAETFRAVPAREVNEGPAIVHPRQPGWVVRQIDGRAVMQQMIWGRPLKLRGSKGQPLLKPANNARFDKLVSTWRNWADAPAHRCLIPTAAFAEAEGEEGRKTTTWLSHADHAIFAWAGLCGPSDEWGPCYTGVMTDAAPGLQKIHDRSPVIIQPRDWETWLNAPFEELQRFNIPPMTSHIRVQRTQVPWGKGGDPTLCPSG